MTSASSTPAGLAVRKTPGGKRWIVVHAASGMPALAESVRLRRQAEAAMADLYASGADFTRPVQDFARDHDLFRQVWPVHEQWRNRVLSGYDTETGEVYGYASLPESGREHNDVQAMARAARQPHDPARQETASHD